MPVLLFRLSGVSEEEADQVRALLDKHSIEFYETTAGRWGVSMPGIWLPDGSQADEAKGLLNEYQAERQARFQNEQQGLMQTSVLSSLWASFWQRPVRFVLALAAILFVLGLSLYPFIDLFVDQ
jgi:hypothetical protein